MILENSHRKRTIERTKLTIVIEQLLNEINVGHKHAPTTIPNQSQCIQCISGIHYYVNTPILKLILGNQVYTQNSSLYPIRIENILLILKK